MSRGICDLAVPVGNCLRRILKLAIMTGVALSTIAAGHGAESDRFRIGKGDLLRVSVFGEEMAMRVLSGEFRVDADGMIDYPILGRVQASGKLPGEVAQAIHASLGEQARLGAAPTVAVAEYAPVFLLGNVQRSGSYPFEPDMTVLKLMLAAGGLPVPPDIDARLVAATQEAAELDLLKFALTVERFRLMAETEDREFDTKSVTNQQPEDKIVIVKNEIARFDARRRAKATQTRTFEAQSQTYDKEIESLRKSIDLHDQEVKLVKEDMNTQQGLADRGLVARSKLSEIKREYVVMQRQALEFRTALYRAEQNKLAAEQKLIESRIATETATWDRLHEVELELGKTIIKLNAATKTLAEVRKQMSVVRNMFGRVPTYTLLRQTDGAYRSNVVDESAKLERGDIVKVDFLADPADRTGSTESERSSFNRP